jgi:hypothetical protein
LTPGTYFIYACWNESYFVHLFSHHLFQNNFKLSKSDSGS